MSTSQIVSSPTSSSRRLPRSSRHDQTCCHRVRLVDSRDRLITHHASSTRQVRSSSRRTLGSTRPELIGRDWDRIVRSTWKMEGFRGMLENAINKIEAISSTPTPNTPYSKMAATRDGLGRVARKRGIEGHGIQHSQWRPFETTLCLVLRFFTEDDIPGS